MLTPRHATTLSAALLLLAGSAPALEPTRWTRETRAVLTAARAEGRGWPAVTVQPLGAARRVTGSMHLVRAPGANVLIDAGLAQGRREEADALNRRELAFDVGEIDAVVITHAHIDHMGLLPRLVKEGYRGPVVCTPTSAEIMEISLRDSAWIQYVKAAEARGHDPYDRRLPARVQARIEAETLYTQEHVRQVMELVRPLAYEEARALGEGVTVRLRDAGHLPGSSLVELACRAGERTVRLVFGGDTGNDPYPLLRSPQTFESPDVLFLESTYGDRHHQAVDLEERYRQFAAAVTEALSDGGRVLMPAFAVGRSHALLAWLDRMKDEGALPKDTPLILDSPMAGRTLQVLQRHPESLDPEKTRGLYDDQGRFFWLDGFRLGHRRGPLPEGSVVIASSGMLTGGKAIRHAQALLPDPRNDLIFSGYAAPRSPARKLMDGETKVHLGDREVEVRAAIRRLSGFSGHADQGMLIDYARRMEPGRVVLVHGEPEAGETLQRLMSEALGVPVDFPEPRRVFVLAE